MALNQRLKEARKRTSPKLTQREVADRMGVTPQAVSAWERGESTPETDKIGKLAKLYAVDANSLLDESNGALTKANETKAQPGTLEQNARIGGAVEGFARIPVRGQGMGGKDGSLLFNSDSIGDVIAPPALTNVTGAYAVYVVGSSMEDRFRAGEVVYVHPYLPVRKGDDCVIQIENDKNERVGWVKRFVSMDEHTLKVEQLNPRKTIKFARNTVVSVHKIIMSGTV